MRNFEAKGSNVNMYCLVAHTGGISHFPFDHNMTEAEPTTSRLDIVTNVVGVQQSEKCNSRCT